MATLGENGQRYYPMWQQMRRPNIKGIIAGDNRSILLAKITSYSLLLVC